MSTSDERRALQVVAPPRRNGRRYRCSHCGLPTPAEELQPDIDDAGKQIGWICENCW